MGYFMTCTNLYRVTENFNSFFHLKIETFSLNSYVIPILTWRWLKMSVQLYYQGGNVNLSRTDKKQ